MLIHTRIYTHTHYMYAPELTTLPTRSPCLVHKRQAQWPPALEESATTPRIPIHNYRYYYADIFYDGRGSISSLPAACYYYADIVYDGRGSISSLLARRPSTSTLHLPLFIGSLLVLRPTAFLGQWRR